jgi:Zn-finger nucleic acid-binding protein
MKASSVLPWSCPNCKLALKSIPGSHAGVMGCARCKGRAVSLNLLSKVSKPELIAELWHHAKAQNRPVGKACPSCRKKSLQVVASPALGSVTLDLCDSCHIVWFDDTELERVVKSTHVPTAPDNYNDELSGSSVGYADRHYDGVDVLFLLDDLVRLFRR